MATPHAEHDTGSDTGHAESAGGFRSFYGAGPLHLVVLLIALALSAYTLSVIGLSALWNPEVWWQSILVWFLGAIIAHDLIVFPLYAAADRVLSLATRSRKRNRKDRPGVSALNYLRVPLIAVALMFVLFFPGILGQGASTYLDATGQTQDPFLPRWLLLSAIIFGLSAAAYALRLITHRRDRSADVKGQ